MNADSVIVISDSETEHDGDVIGLESTQSNVYTISSDIPTLRVPVSWTESPPYRQLPYLVSQQPFSSSALDDKVSSWLYQKCQTPGARNATPFIANKSSILIRKDYRKPTPTPTLLTENLRSSSVSVISSSHRRSSAESDFLNNTCSELHKPNLAPQLERITAESPMEHGIIASASNLCDNHTDKLNSSGVQSISGAPNKIEFCEYLQLKTMTPTETKNVGMKQTRRSSRVKNLTLMSEKRALERELTSDNQETNTPDQELKSCTNSDSSKGSREGSQKSDSTKVDNLEELKNFKDNLHSVLLTKSLQVPEVSTTSTSGLQIISKVSKNRCSNSNYYSKDVDKYVCNEQSLPFPNTPGSKSIIMTKQSFDELKIDMVKLEEEQELHKVIRRFLKYLTTKPSEAFEDCYQSYFSDPENSKFLPKIETNKSDVKQKSSNATLKVNINKLRTRLRRKLQKPKGSTKSKFRHKIDNLPFNKRILRKQISKRKFSKQQQKLFLSPRRDLSKLRSRGKLKEIGINSVLLRSERIKKTKKKFKMKASQVSPKRPHKNFISTTLIQNKSSTEVTEVSPSECSPLKALRLQTELDALKYLTPEHRKAIFERKRFLAPKVVSKLTVNTIIQDNNFKDVFEAVSSLVTSKDTNVSLEARSDVGLSRPSSADFEVDKLMSGHHFKQRGQGTSSSSSKHVPYKEQEQCVSECEKSRTATTSSFDTVKSDLEESTNSSNRKLLEMVLKSQKSLINEKEIIESSPTHETELKMEEDDSDFEYEPEIVNISNIKGTKIDCIHLVDDNETAIQTLHECLTQTREKPKERMETPPPKNTNRKSSQSYAIHLSPKNGAVMNCFYLDYNLVVVQELLISFWNQTSLGNMLGAQNMWMPKGNTKRLVLGNGCTHKDSAESLMGLDNSIAYFELWTKEHKSDKRERPVADIFVTIYLRLNGNGPDKKVLQLENINSYANDVQYIVLRNAPFIIVSWSTINDEKSTSVLHKYQLSSDYQAVTNITAMQPPAHYVASLHNIEDSDTLIMASGEDKITLWHIDNGYVVASMDLMAIALQPRTLWAKADRGFIFTLHNFNDGYLHLIATNSFDYSWKQLQVYKQDSEYENLLGICIDNGLVIAFYDNGILCWKAKSGELIIDSSCENNIFLPFGKHIVSIIKNQVHVRHALEYLVTIES